jgi:hypothetical protein
MGRPKVAALRALATQHGWLDADTPLPEDGEIAAVLGQARRARSTISTVEPFRDIVARWAEQCRVLAEWRSTPRCVASTVSVRCAPHRAWSAPDSYSTAREWVGRAEKITIAATPRTTAQRFSVRP